MSMRTLSAIGIFATATQAEVGVDVLMTAGFKSSNISVLLPEQRNTKMPERSEAQNSTEPQGSKTANVTAIGATAGGALVGSLAVLAGARRTGHSRHRTSDRRGAVARGAGRAWGWRRGGRHRRRIGRDGASGG